MIVVTGATGNVGRTLVQALTAARGEVTAVSRGNAAIDLPGCVRHRRADLGEPATLRPALDGADALFVLIAGAQLSAGVAPTELLDVVAASTVRRVVLLSSQGAETRSGATSHARLRSFEDAVARSGLDWTVLRPGGFDSNAYAWADMVRTQRSIAAPFTDVGLPLVDPADIAEVAAKALVESGHNGACYTLTGPTVVTPREQAGAIGDAIGAEVDVVELSREQAKAGMVRFMPEPVADGTLDILGEPTAAEQQPSPDVERVLGRAPRTFAEWAARNRAAFR